MNPLPVAYRELLVLGRRPALYWLRSVAGLLVALLAVVVVLVNLGVGATPNSIGRPLFLVLSGCAAGLCLLAGPALLSDSIAEEKRAGTLGLLRLTHLRSYDIVAGKTAGLVMPAVQGLLVILPALTTGFFLGGVSGAEFTRSGIALLNLLFFSMAVAVLCSAVFSSGRRALAVSAIVMLSSAAAHIIIERAVPVLAQLPAPLLAALAAPVAALPAGWEWPAAYDAARFLRLVGGTQLAGWVCLAGACVAVDRAWRGGGVARAPAPKWTPRWVPKRGGPVLRWLATRQVGGADWLWAYVAICAGLLWWLKGRATANEISLLDFAVVAWVLHGVFKVIIGWTAVRALGGERDSGALEMLFVTPLGEVAVWQAWLGALRQKFLGPALALAGFDLWLARQWTASEAWLPYEWPVLLPGGLGVAMFLLDGYTLCWVGLWQGLVQRTATRATVRTLGLLLVLPTLLCLPALGVLGGWGSLSQKLGTISAWWFVVGCLLNVLLGAWTMVRVSDDLREAVLRRG